MEKVEHLKKKKKKLDSATSVNSLIITFDTDFVLEGHKPFEQARVRTFTASVVDQNHKPLNFVMAYEMLDVGG